jgi:hypothetical protein
VRLGSPNLGLAFHDNGCRVAPHCLTCPRATCIYDDPPHAHANDAARERMEEMAHLRRIGVPYLKIQLAYGVSERTVHRAVARAVARETLLRSTSCTCRS